MAPKPRFCRKCNIEFTRPYNLTVHNQQQHAKSVKKVVCPICLILGKKKPQLCSNITNLKKHFKRIHDDYDKQKISNGKFNGKNLEFKTVKKSTLKNGRKYESDDSDSDSDDSEDLFSSFASSNSSSVVQTVQGRAQRAIKFSTSDEENKENEETEEMSESPVQQLPYRTTPFEFVRVDLSPVRNEKIEPEAMNEDHQFDALINWLNDVALKGHISGAVISDRGLQESPFTVLDPNTQPNTNDSMCVHYLPVLLINPRDPLIQELIRRIKNDATNLSEELALILFETALVRSGFALQNPADFAKRVYELARLAFNISTFGLFGQSQEGTANLLFN